MRIKDFNNFLALYEKRVENSELVEQNQFGLILHNGGRGTKETTLTLYDFKNKKVMGFIEAIKKKGEIPELAKSAAEKGYGPSMYDFILMSFDEGLVPDRESVSEAALNIWRHFLNNRSDVKKESISKEDPSYINSYIKHEDKDEDPVHKDEEGLKILNTNYKLSPSKEYADLIERGNELMKEHSTNSNNINKAGNLYFTKKYY